MRVDSFTREDSNDLGPGWYESEQAVGRISIYSNQLALGDGGNVGICYRTEAWAPNQSCSLKFKSRQGGPCGGPAIRMSGVYTACYGYVVYHNASTLYLKKFVNNNVPTSGGGTDLGDPASCTIVANDILKIEAIGTTIKVYVNDVEYISVVDSSITTGKPGGIGNGYYTYWTDFVGLGDIKGLTFSW